MSSVHIHHDLPVEYRSAAERLLTIGLQTALPVALMLDIDHFAVLCGLQKAGNPVYRVRC
jgi:hypothetical protein